MSENSHSARTVALVGGGGLIGWWLLSRGRGWGFRPGNGDDSAAAVNPNSGTAPCIVWIRAARIEIDGVPAELEVVVAKCRVAGTAEVHATGDAITGTVMKVLQALANAGVKLRVAADLAPLLPSSVLS